MKASRFLEAQKAFILKQGADGVPVADICRKAGISQATYFNWKKKYDVMQPPEMRRLKQLEDGGSNGNGSDSRREGHSDSRRHRAHSDRPHRSDNLHHSDSRRDSHNHSRHDSHTHSQARPPRS